MKLVRVTTVENNQAVYIPLYHIDSIRYPTVNGNTLVTWSNGDGSMNYEEVMERPGDIRVVSLP